MLAWRLIESSEPATGPANMGLDAALLEAVKSGAAPVLRFYRWDPPCLSFGRNQPARGLYDAGAAAARGIDLVRRPTGGQAVYHDDELTYAVIAPVDAVGRPREAYGRMNQALAMGLARLGAAVTAYEPAPAAAVVDARMGAWMGGDGAVGPPAAGRAAVAARPATGPAPARVWTAACFRRPARGEVVARGRKLVGSAQRCEGRVILQHGSILLGGSQAPAEALLVSGAAGGDHGAPGSSGAGWTTLEAVLGRRPEPGDLVAALVAGFETVLGISLARSTVSTGEADAAARLRSRFASSDWTWRR